VGEFVCGCAGKELGGPFGGGGAGIKQVHDSYSKVVIFVIAMFVMRSMLCNIWVYMLAIDKFSKKSCEALAQSSCVFHKPF
jgi:hypothetical protein